MRKFVVLVISTLVSCSLSDGTSSADVDIERWDMNLEDVTKPEDRGDDLSEDELHLASEDVPKRTVSDDLKKSICYAIG